MSPILLMTQKMVLTMEKMLEKMMKEFLPLLEEIEPPGDLKLEMMLRMEVKIRPTLELMMPKKEPTLVLMLDKRL